MQVLQVLWPAGLDKHVLLEQRGRRGLVIVLKLQDSWRKRRDRGSAWMNLKLCVTVTVDKWPYGEDESSLGACQGHLSARTVNCLRINRGFRKV